MEIDNNLVENAIRPLALERKNYLFAGSHDAAQRAAVIHFLLGTCKLHGVKPWLWLADVIDVLPIHPAERAMELLPHHWKQSQEEEKTQAAKQLLPWSRENATACSCLAMGWKLEAIPRIPKVLAPRQWAPAKGAIRRAKSLEVQVRGRTQREARRGCTGTLYLLKAYCQSKTN